MCIRDRSFTVYPAIDVRAGRVVRLAQGDYTRETRYAADPLAQAMACLLYTSRCV